MRIVSLLASATEIVCALGLEKQLVGRSHECDFPPSILNLPQCTETKFKTSGTSSEIDSRIKEIVKQGLSVYRVFEECLKELRPDVIVTQIQCEVCAVSEKDVQAALCNWLDYRPNVVSLNPQGLDDIWADIQRVAEATGVSLEGKNLTSRLQNRMAEISSKVRQLSYTPSVACIEWIDPLMAAGNWMPDLVTMAGGLNLFGIANQHSPWMTWEDLVKKDPDVIMVLPCGWDIERIHTEMPFLTSKREWPLLKAVQNKQVYLADGNQYFNRPGPRVVESLEILAEIFHPKTFSFGHEGRGWKRFIASHYLHVDRT